MSSSVISNSIDVCRKFNYFLHGNKELMNQPIYTFFVGRHKFHIPHIELIRAFFCLNKSLCNAILRPNGFARLLNRVEINDGEILLEFSREFPASSLNNQVVTHIAWILSDPLVRSLYDSVWFNIITSERKREGVPLSIDTPNLTGIELNYRGLQKEEEVLLLEILSLNNLPINVTRVIYSHPLIRQRIMTFSRKTGPPKMLVLWQNKLKGRGR